VAIRFDQSLPNLVRVVVEHLGEVALQGGVALRDTTGRLAFFAGTPLSEEVVEDLSLKLRAALGPYARSDRIVAGSTDFGVAEILRDPLTQTVKADNRLVRVIDRRLVGADWLRTPAPAAPPPPRFVFASLKGGVGRSTALCVAAADFASRGLRVLAVDLDMEAPGLGSMLLDEKTVPEFGLIDALVESGLSPLDDRFLADVVAPSALADRRGRIDVLPAFGRQSMDNPGNVLAKIARAYAEHVGENGTVTTILDQVKSLVDRLANAQRYDAIFVDARAGLHETTAAAVLGLGAEVFLFGLDEPQTFQGYAALLAHLARFVPPAGPPPEWLTRLTMVQGRVASTESQALFAEKCQTLFARLGLARRAAATGTGVPLPAEPFHDVPWDDDTRDEDFALDEGSDLNEPLVIFEDDRFRLFNPAAQHDLLSVQVYRSSYGRFVDAMADALPANEENPA
jgi:hypothetical protein